eukprot:5294387-Prorocentrum_lima.AAC.1
MTSSLVGSEMCIRDSISPHQPPEPLPDLPVHASGLPATKLQQAIATMHDAMTPGLELEYVAALQ